MPSSGLRATTQRSGACLQKTQWFFLANDHFNPAGSQRAAELLYDDLAARGWLETDP